MPKKSSEIVLLLLRAGDHETVWAKWVSTE